MRSGAQSTWPTRFRVYRFGGLFLAVICGVLLIRAWILFTPPLERFCLRTYVTGELPAARIHRKDESFPVVFIGTFRGSRGASDSPGSPAWGQAPPPRSHVPLLAQGHIYHGKKCAANAPLAADRLWASVVSCSSVVVPFSIVQMIATGDAFAARADQSLAVQPPDQR
jgi:hypothetical protein